MINTLNKDSYYDIDFDMEEVLCDGNLYNELFHVKDLKQRKLFLNDEICSSTVSDIVRHILQYNAEDRDITPSDRTPILLYITSTGGEVDSGFELISAIQCSKTPIYTINLGYQYSMAFLIGLAGYKRYAMPNAQYLMHDGSSMIFGSTTKVQDQIEFRQRVEQRIKEFVLTHSKISNEEYESKRRIEWYLFADEAKEKGFTDCIIGSDCEIDEII